MSESVVAEVELNPTQLLAAQSTARFPLMVSGMGAGKSYALDKIYLGRMDENRAFMRRDTPAMYFAPTYDMIDNMIAPRLEKNLYDLGIPYRLMDDRHLLEAKYRGETCYTRLLSAENYDRYMGPEVPFMMGDELELCFRANPVKIELMWRKLISRLRVKGTSRSFNVASTPEGFGFLWDWWENKPSKNPELRKDYAYYRCSTSENERNLDPDYIPMLERDFSGPLIRAYLHGEFVNLTAGSVYYAFDRERHVTRGLQLRPGLPLELCFDFNVDPCTCVVCQYQAPDVVVVDCIQDSSGRGTDELCRRVVAEYGEFAGPCLVYGDASGVSKDSTSAGKSDRSIIDELIGRHWLSRGYDTRWTSSNPWPPDRYAAVNGIFASGRAVIDERAEGLINDLMRQPYKKNSREADSLKGKIGHASDAWGYRIHRDFPVKRTLAERARGIAA